MFLLQTFFNYIHITFLPSFYKNLTLVQMNKNNTTNIILHRFYIEIERIQSEV